MHGALLDEHKVHRYAAFRRMRDVSYHQQCGPLLLAHVTSDRATRYNTAVAAREDTREVNYEIHERDYTRAELLRRVGNLSQIGGTRHYTLAEGRSKGVAAVDVDTGAGLRFTVLPDRGLDISAASFEGTTWSTGLHTARFTPATTSPGSWMAAHLLRRPAHDVRPNLPGTAGQRRQR